MKKAVLVITNEQDLHADIVIQEIEKRGGAVIRLNTDQLVGSSKFHCTIDSESTRCSIVEGTRRIDPDACKSVWYRKPAPPRIAEKYEGPHRTFVEDETRQALEGFMLLLQGKTWVNPYWKLDVASNKVLQLDRARKMGMRIPRSIVTTDPTDVREFYKSCNGAMIYKTLYSPVIDYPGEARIIRTQLMPESELEKLTHPMSQPCLFQEQIEKKQEIRVTVIGDDVFAAEMHTQDLASTRIDWRRPEGFHQIKCTQHNLPAHLKRQILDFLRHDDLCYGALDFIMTPTGEYVFLENNPNGEWLWIQINTKLPIAETLANKLLEDRPST